MHKTHIVFENLSNINGDMLQKAWGFKIGDVILLVFDLLLVGSTHGRVSGLVHFPI